MPIVSFDDPLVRTWALHSGILSLKMLGMSCLTNNQRHCLKVVNNPEDAALLKVEVSTDERVERVRRAHLNDIENIPTFICVSWLYMMTNPCPKLATTLFCAVTGCRFMFTFVYAVYPIRQPARMIAFVVPYWITIFMAVKSIIYFWK